MAITANKAVRVFKFEELELSDPGSHMSPEEVVSFYSNQYPELTTATLGEPKMEDGKLVYPVDQTLGTKG